LDSYSRFFVIWLDKPKNQIQMKKIILLGAVSIIMVSCQKKTCTCTEHQSSHDTDVANQVTGSDSERAQYIYTIEPRELFVPIPIEARSGNHALLKDGKVQVIGYVTDRKRYTSSGGCLIPREVYLHFGNPLVYSDFFYFENMTLVYQAVGIKTPEYITDVYAECAMMKSITPDEFIEKVVGVYTLTELGF
jgi:hypothetical protein